MTAPTADDVRSNRIGAWRLQSYEARSIDGSDVIYPLGVDPQGIIIYTCDGYISAQLMRSDRLRFSSDTKHPAADGELAAARRYLTYAGPYSVVGDGLIAHDVAVSLVPNWIGGTRIACEHVVVAHHIALHSRRPGRRGECSCPLTRCSNRCGLAHWNCRTGSSCRR
jgi:hypothetical protein